MKKLIKRGSFCHEGLCSSGPEAGPRAEAWLPDIRRPQHQLTQHLHSPKQRVKLLCKLLIVGVKVWAFVHVVERQLALFVVQEQPDFPGCHRLRQLDGRNRQSLQVCAPVQTEAQVSCLRVEGAEALSPRWCFSHAEPPVALAHLHLPVVAPTGVARRAHSTPPAVKALPVLCDFLSLQTTAHALPVTGGDQVCVGWILVQGHILWRRLENVKSWITNTLFSAKK